MWEECEAARAAELEGGPRIETVEEDRVAFEDVTVLTPGSRKPLLNRLSVDASDLQPLLIKERSGIGKTSLLRALAGLWQDGTGRITRPALGQVMFLPQRPYLILGTLRDQLCYPRANQTDDATLREVLVEVNLADLAERFGGFDAELNWSDVLSPGEQQRLAFARLAAESPRLCLSRRSDLAHSTARTKSVCTIGCERAEYVSFRRATAQPCSATIATCWNSRVRTYGRSAQAKNFSKLPPPPTDTATPPG